MSPDFFPSHGAEVGTSFVVIAGLLWSFVIMIFWMVVGWRAMKAHELIAAASLRQMETAMHDSHRHDLPHNDNRRE